MIVLLQSHGYQSVTIQSDRLEMVKVLQDTPSVASSYALIMRIQQLLMHVGYWRLWHVSREDNQAADRIAKMASDGKEGL